MNAATTHTESNADNAQFLAPETHQRAADVAAALATGTRIGLGTTPYGYLPLFARIAIERLDGQSDLRTAQTLDEMLAAYAKSMGRTVDLETCASAHHICARRFWDFSAAPRA